MLVYGECECLILSCRCCMFVSCVHPVAVLNAAFCMTCSLLMLVEDAIDDHTEEHQTDTACSWLVCHSRGDCRGEHCANCIHLPRLSGGPAAQFFWKPAVRPHSTAGGAPTPCGRH